LGKCDDATGKEPYNGANATLEQMRPFADYIFAYVEKKLTYAIDLVEGKISDITETDKRDIDPVNDLANDPVNRDIIYYLKQNPYISYDMLSEKTGHSRATIKRRIQELKRQNVIERVGSDKTGYWRIN
jgi:predicted HTH transcriptional regulator